VTRVVFACVHNAGRSQMAAAFFNRAADPARAVAISAGTQPGERVHAEVVAAMREAGIDLSQARPRRLTSELAADAAWLVTMGCEEECPVIPGVRREDWPLRDPKGCSLQEVRDIRDEVRKRVHAFVEREELGRAVEIHTGGRDQMPEVVAFLAANSLPEAGLAEHATDLLVAREGERLVGTAALEAYGRDALLRSVAVAPDARGTGLGVALSRAALDRARATGVGRVFLLTETAPLFFRRLGFRDVERASVPESIKGTVEFASACPASARVMVLDLS
jgi:arsenate reductase